MSTVCACECDSLSRAWVSPSDLRSRLQWICCDASISVQVVVTRPKRKTVSIRSPVLVPAPAPAIVIAPEPIATATAVAAETAPIAEETKKSCAAAVDDELGRLMTEEKEKWIAPTEQQLPPTQSQLQTDGCGAVPLLSQAAATAGGVTKQQPAGAAGIVTPKAASHPPYSPLLLSTPALQASLPISSAAAATAASGTVIAPISHTMTIASSSPRMYPRLVIPSAPTPVLAPQLKSTDSGMHCISLSPLSLFYVLFGRFAFGDEQRWLQVLLTRTLRHRSE